MKIGHKPEQPIAICTLKVKIIYPTSDSTYSEKLLASLPLTTVSFNSENYSTFDLSYKIEGLPGNITDSPVIGEDFKVLFHFMYKFIMRWFGPTGSELLAPLY
ncbi:MAG: hypothetical protein IPG53_22360 [Ignavibacteriales bacterium]|nr:hypothetical protein [Ignavibacteriales bacterium]